MGIAFENSILFGIQLAMFCLGLQGTVTKYFQVKILSFILAFNIGIQHKLIAFVIFTKLN